MGKAETSINEYVPLVAWVAHNGAGKDTGDAAVSFLRRMMGNQPFLMTDDNPDIILFMSGGSERLAISMINPDHPVLLIAIKGNNAYAAATEVMARIVNNKGTGLLFDAEDAFHSGLVGKWIHISGIWKGFWGKKAGLIGSVSEWLVASATPVQRFREVFGVTTEQIPWENLDDFSTLEPDMVLANRFSGTKAAGLTDAAKVLSLLRQVVQKNGLSAIAVECFSLVQQRRVTACLALAELNNEGKVAACEGDLASMAGMMLMEAVSGSPVWMANTTGVSGETLSLSHCTIAFDLVNSASLETHFETDCSLAVKGAFSSEEVTIFRFSESLESAFLAEGKITGRPFHRNACRTQIEVKLPPSLLDILRTRPLGNHLVVAPGCHAELIRLACFCKGIKMLE